MARKTSDAGRPELKKARQILGLSQIEAAQLIGTSQSALAYYESGSGRDDAKVLSNIRNLCRAYMEKAVELGYDGDEFHESILCPGEFPKPAKVAA